ncbi:MAG: LemA family protein [Verrucomicrobiales bacterium]
MKKGIVVLLAILALLIGGVLVIAMWGVGLNNQFVVLRQKVDAQWAQVQNTYQRRADLIPNLVNTVSGAANFEKSTITEVTQARASVNSIKIDPNSSPDPETIRKFQAAQDQLSGALSRLLVVVEKYPDLRATQNFRDLQAQLEGTENRIAVERGRYNDVVRDYNSAIEKFPGQLVAGFRGFKPKEYFQSTAGAEKAPTVQFDFNKKTN